MSIIVRRIKSALRRIVCWALCSPMLTATKSFGAIQFQYSTDHRPQFSRSRMKMKKQRWLAIGSQNKLNRELRHTNSVCLSSAQLNRAQATMKNLEFRSKFSMNTLKRRVDTLRSATMHWRRDLNFAPWSSWRVMMRLFRCRSGSRQSVMIPICERFMTRNGTCFTLPAPGHGIIYLSQVFGPLSEFLDDFTKSGT